MQKPIRIGLIGLSSNAITSWASQAHLPYLLSERGRSRYEIVALLNSSIASAESAKKTYSLPSTVKAYDNPADLAADEDVDLVVCSVRVDLHHETVMPSVRAGKAVFVEWPLAHNVNAARELRDAAAQSGARTLVGVQLRMHPFVQKVRQLLREDAVGEVLSSRINSASPFSERGAISEGLAYFIDKKVGGNPIVIMFGHMIDYVRSVLPLDQSTIKSITQIQRTSYQIYEGGMGGTKSDKSVLRTETSDVPDLLSLHAKIQPSPFFKIAPDATLSVNFRSQPPFPGETAHTWHIEGSKGELLVTAPRTSLGETAEIKVHDFASGEVRKFGWDDVFGNAEEWERALPERSLGTGRLYDAFFDGKDAPELRKEVGTVGFEEAVELQEIFDGTL